MINYRRRVREDFSDLIADMMVAGCDENDICTVIDLSKKFLDEDKEIIKNKGENK